MKPITLRLNRLLRLPHDDINAYLVSRFRSVMQKKRMAMPKFLDRKLKREYGEQ